MITAKVFLYNKMEENGQVNLYFNADYADGRNKEWAKYTPSLSLTMAVLPEVAEKFEVSSKYLLTFTPSED